jgi:hypothetical protein
VIGYLGGLWASVEPRQALVSIFDPSLTNFGDPEPGIAAARAHAADPAARLYPTVARAGASFIYPPLAAAFYAPLARLPAGSAHAALLVLNRLLLAGIFVTLVALLDRGRGGRSLGLALGALLLCYPLHRAVLLNQATLAVTFLLGVAMAALRWDRQRLAGIALALACTVKPQLALVLPLLFWHARRAMITAALSGVVLLAASLAWGGTQNHIDYLTQVLPALSAGYAFFPNQSWHALSLRLLTRADIGAFALAPPSAAAHALALGLSVATWASGLYAAWRWRKQPVPPVFVLGWAWLVATLASPIAWEHHYAPAVFLLAMAWTLLRDGAAEISTRLLGAGCLAFVLVMGYFPVEHLRGPAGLIVSYRFFGGLVLAGVWALLLDRRASEPARLSLGESRRAPPPTRARVVVTAVTAASALVLLLWVAWSDKAWFERHVQKHYVYFTIDEEGRLAGWRALGVCLAVWLIVRVRRRWAARAEAQGLAALARGGLLVVGAAVAALGVAELVLRWKAPPPPPEQFALPLDYRDLSLVVRDARLGWIQRPSFATTVQVGDRSIHYAFDADGNRAASPDARLDLRRPTIAFLGESIVAGHGLEYEETIPAQVGRLLGVQVVNLGVPGYGSDQSYLRWHDVTRRLPPLSAVVSLFHGPELERNAWTFRPRLVVDPGGVLRWEPPSHAFFDRLRLTTLSRNLLPYHSEAGFEVARAVFAQTAREAHDLGAMPLYVLFSWGPPRPIAAHKEAWLHRELFERQGLRSVVVDVERFIEGDGHPVPAEARRIAEAIAAALPRGAEMKPGDGEPEHPSGNAPSRRTTLHSGKRGERRRTWAAGASRRIRGDARTDSDDDLPR